MEEFRQLSSCGMRNGISAWLLLVVTLGTFFILPFGHAAESFEELKVKAEKGEAIAQNNLGAMYAYGAGVVKDKAEAVKWYRKAAEQGHALAQANLGFMYAYGNGVVKDEVEAVRWYRKAAEQGHAPAQFNLGVMYANGDGDPNNESLGTALGFGWWYVRGNGVVKDEAEAVKWYRKAAEQGYAKAQFNLGFMYANGNGVVKDEAEAVRWFRKAAEQGYAKAQFNLGFMYANGNGVVKDEAEAVRWFRKAAEQGQAIAQFNLGFMYAHGIGVVKDEAEAVRWYRKAAEQGHASAQTCLGFMYANGNGVVKDDVEAYKWYLLAGSQGEENAKKNILIIERELTADQRAEGQKLARLFKPRGQVPADAATPQETVAQTSPKATGSGFFITEDGYLITNQHVVGEGASVRVLTSKGSILAKVVKVDAANDLALLKAEGRFVVLPVLASRAVKLCGTVATVGFPNIGLQGFAPKVLAHGGPRAKSRRCPALRMTRGISKSACRCSRAIRAAHSWTSAAM